MIEKDIFVCTWINGAVNVKIKRNAIRRNRHGPEKH
jgi:hypothetical protein